MALDSTSPRPRTAGRPGSGQATWAGLRGVGRDHAYAIVTSPVRLESSPYLATSVLVWRDGLWTMGR